MIRARVGYLTHLDGEDSPDRLYERSLRVARRAEQLGFDGIWVSERHFHLGRAGLPDALTWLAAAARETTLIQLGTAVVAAPLRHPVDIAERAALVDALAAGRLQLGLGSGVGGTSPAVFEAPTGEASSARTDEIEREVDRLLRGGQIRANVGDGTASVHEAPAEPEAPAETERVFPPRPQLADRIWRGSQSERAAALAAELGHGLLLPRSQYGAADSRDIWQRKLIQRYRDAVSTPRIAVSRTLYPADSVEAGLDEFVRRRTRFGPTPTHAETRAEVAAELAAGDVVYGPPDVIEAALDADVALAVATDALIGFQPGILTEDEELDKLETLARVTGLTPRETH